MPKYKKVVRQGRAKVSMMVAARNTERSMMKTSISVLNEMAQALHLRPQYDFLGQTDPPDQMFIYTCSTSNVLFIGVGSSKKFAKRNAASKLLETMSKDGHLVPRPYAHKNHEGKRPIAALSYVSVLSTWCKRNSLAAAKYVLVGESGPSHMRNYMMCVRIGPIRRFATASSKKRARQLAAEQLFLYLRGVVETEKLTRAIDTASHDSAEISNNKNWKQEPNRCSKMANFRFG